MSRWMGLTVMLMALGAGAEACAQGEQEWPPVEERWLDDDPRPPRPDDPRAPDAPPQPTRDPAPAPAPDRDQPTGRTAPPAAGGPVRAAPLDGDGASALPRVPKHALLGGRLRLEAYAWVVTDVKGSVERERGRIGRDWSLHDDLDMNEDTAGQVYLVEVRLTPAISVVAEYLNLGLDGETRLAPNDANAFNGQGFAAGERVKTEIDFHQLRVDLAYGWSSDVLTVGGLLGVRSFFVRTAVDSRSVAGKKVKSRTRLTSPEVGLRFECRFGDPDLIEGGGFVRSAAFAYPKTDGYGTAWFELEMGAAVTIYGIFKVQAGFRYLTAYLRTDHGGDDEKAELHLFGPIAGVSLLF